MADTLTDADVAALAAPKTGMLTDADVAAMASKPEQSYEAGLLRTLIGQGAAMGWGDEIMGRLRQLAGEDYETARDDERAKVAAFKKENPKAALGAELGGAFLTPGLGLLGGALKPAATVGAKMWQGTKLGAGVGALAGAGAAETDTLEGAKHGAMVGGVLGGGLSGAGAVIGNAITKTLDTAAPTLARTGAKLTGHANPEEAAADATLKSWLRNSGDSPASLRKFFDDVEQASRFNSNSITDLPVVLADASPGLQKLAGSVVRGNPEGAKIGEAVLGARQTGVTPRGELADIATSAGISHRNPLAPRETGQEPTGMFERIGDALKRAFTIADKDHHKFGETAYRTEQAMMARLKQESSKLYGEAKAASNGVDVGQTIGPIIKQMLDDTASMQTTGASLIKKALRLFTTGDGKLVTDLHGFDQGKKALDSLISKMRNPTQPDKYGEMILTDLKNKLLGAVDSIPTNGVGDKYKAARNYFSSEMEMKDALDLGRKAWREDAQVAADQIKELTEGQQKLFRLGLHDAYMSNKGTSSRAADVTRIFETPRMQEILEASIPRSEKSTAVFANRPERFGDLVGVEKTMSATKNKVFGNSMTAERLADDARLGRATIGEMFDRYRSSPSLFAIGMEIVSTGLNKVFGFRDDVAKELARRLFTADKTQREAILARIEQSWGSDRIGALSKWMGALTEATSAAIPGQTGLMIGQNKK